MIKTAPKTAADYQADPDTQNMIDWAAASGLPPLYTLTPDAAREQSATGGAKVKADPQEVDAVADHVIDGPGGDLAIRSYTPLGAAGGDPLPIILYYHGGGFVIGSIDTHDSICRLLANTSGAIVASVDYRLAPEARYPAAVEDAVAGVHWAAAEAGSIGGDAARLVVAGDSAGGNLAAVAAQKLQTEGGPALAAQMLFYPITDHAHGNHPSREEQAETFPIPTPVMDWFHNHYFGHDNPVPDLDASPFLKDSLAGVPPAYVMTAGLDPLRDEGAAYAERLREAGVAVEYKCWETTIHGFLQMAKVIPQAIDATTEAGEWLGRRLGTKG